jgi:hypothetical protein
MLFSGAQFNHCTGVLVWRRHKVVLLPSPLFIVAEHNEYRLALTCLRRKPPPVSTIFPRSFHPKIFALADLGIFMCIILNGPSGKL